MYLEFKIVCITCIDVCPNKVIFKYLRNKIWLVIPFNSKFKLIELRIELLKIVE
jgi:polyferredoxin